MKRHHVTRRRLIVFDSDCLNPYGLELALQLAGLLPVRVAAAADATFGKQLIRYPFRPMHRAPSLRSVLRELVSVTKVSSRLLVGDRVIVVWARTYQKVVLGLVSHLNRSSRLIYVRHNPRADREPSRTSIQGVADAMIRRGAWRTIVHGAALADSVPIKDQANTVLVPHLVYRRYWERFAGGEVATGSALLLLGRVRPDKFSRAELESLLERVDRVSSREVDVILCLRPAMGNFQSLSHVNLINRTSEAYISDHELVRALLDSAVLVAPYVNVTDSGTINLALSAGLDVVAFDGGALGEYLRPDQLVSPGDWDDLAERAVVKSAKPSRAGRDEVHARGDAVLRAWLDAIEV